MDTIVAIGLGLLGLILLAAAVVILLPLFRPPPPGGGAASAGPASPFDSISTPAERQRRFAEARPSRQPDLDDPRYDRPPDFTSPEMEPHEDVGGILESPGHPDDMADAPSAAVGGEIVQFGPGQRPTAVQRMSGPVIDNRAWQDRQQQMDLPPRRNALLTIGAMVVGTLMLIGVLALILWLVRTNAQAQPLTPGTAVLTVADFGEGPAVSNSDTGTHLAETLRTELQADAQPYPQMHIQATGRLTTQADAERALLAERTHALVWGTLPQGATGTVSATLLLRTLAPGEPWERIGAAGRLLLPPAIALPDQPLVARNALEPLLFLALQYQSGNFEAAAETARALQSNDNAATRGAAGFLLANALVVQDHAADALPIYARLAEGGWINPALLNNWGLAADLAGQPDTARNAYGQALTTTPPPTGVTLARILTNRGRTSLYLVHDRLAARADFLAALQADPQQAEAARELGYMAYEDANVATARRYTDQARQAGPDDPATIRQGGLVTLLEGDPAGALNAFQQVLDTYDGWIATLNTAEGAALGRGDQASALQATDQIRTINHEKGTTQYFRGLALSEQARTEPLPNGLDIFLRKVNLKSPSHAEQAIAAFNDAIRLDRDRPDARYELGVLNRRLGNRDEARRQFDAAKTLDDTLPGPYEQLAAMDMEDKKPQDAINEYEALIAVNPNNLPAYIQVAALYHQNNQPAKEADAYQRALAVPAQTADDHFNRAHALQALGQTDAARAEAQAAVDADPTNAAAHLMLGQLEQAAGENTAALTEYASVTRLNPADTEAAYQAGRIYAATGAVDQALMQWQEVERRDPKHPLVHFDLAALYAQTGHPDQARGEYEKAVQNGTNLAEAYTHLGQLDEASYNWHQAESDYRAALTRDSLQLDARDGLVRTLLRLYRPDDAIKVAQDGIRVSADSPRPYVELAQAYLAKDDPSAAATPLATAQARAPGDPAVLTALGHAALLRNDDAGAQQNLNAALAAQPNNPEAAALLGDNDYNHQRFVAAAAWYSKTVAMTPPDYPPAHAGLGRVAEQQGQSQQALMEYAKAITVDSGYAEGHGFLGDFYRARSQWAPAADQYRAAIALRPHWADAHFSLAEVDMQLGQTPEAVSEYTQATRDDPQYPEAWFGLGEAQRVSNNRKEAIAAYQQAVKLKADYAQAWLWLGYTLRDDGQHDAAADAFRHARDTAPNDTIRAAATSALATNQP